MRTVGNACFICTADELERQSCVPELLTAASDYG